MGSALPGSHYCKNHQGNGSHYSTQNCHLCYALARIDELLEKINAAPLTPIVADKGSVQYGNGQSGAAPDLRELLRECRNEFQRALDRIMAAHGAKILDGEQKYTAEGRLRPIIKKLDAAMLAARDEGEKT